MFMAVFLIASVRTDVLFWHDFVSALTMLWSDKVKKNHLTVFFSSLALNDTKSFLPNCDLTVGVLFCLALN